MATRKKPTTLTHKGIIVGTYVGSLRAHYSLEIVKSYKFHLSTQEESELAANFMVALRKLVPKCGIMEPIRVWSL